MQNAVCLISTTIRDGNGARSAAATIQRLFLHPLHDSPANVVRHLAEDDVFIVKVGGFNESDEEL